MPDPIETERMALRPLTLDDVDTVVELHADPEVMRLINGGRPSTREEVTAMITARRCDLWLATDRTTGEVLGWFELRPTAEAEWELGYRLRRGSWGRGLATEGGRRLVDRAFSELGAARVWARTMVVNGASRRVMEKCGLRFAHLFRGEYAPFPGSEHGDVEYELLRTEWEAGRPGPTS